MEENPKRRRSYHAYSSSSNNKKQRKYSLTTGAKGFLCSCNNREKECIRETYNILNKYADQLYGSQSSKEKETGTQQADIDDDFKREVEALKNDGDRKFQIVDSGAKNFLFVRTTLENPVELAHAIITDISRTKREQTRFLIRLIPVEITCKAYLDDVKKAFEVLVNKHFKDGAKSFSVVFNHRNNNSLSRDAVIQEIADMVNKQNAQHKVDLKNAEVSVIIEVIRGIALLAVVPDYFKYKKYNLHLICQGEKEVNNAEVENKEASDTEEVKNVEASDIEEVKNVEASDIEEVKNVEASDIEEVKNVEVSNAEVKKGEVKCDESKTINSEGNGAEIDVN